MLIKGFEETSFIAWEGRISSVIELAGDNMPSIWNRGAHIISNIPRDKVSWQHIRATLEKNKGWVDGIVITGGEPTIHETLPDLCQKIKAAGFQIKLDTNGTNPSMIDTLIRKKLVDYISLEIKAPMRSGKYSKVTGIIDQGLFAAIRRSISMLLFENIPHEFKTVVVPGYHTTDDIREIAIQLRSANKYVIQNFNPDEANNPAFSEIQPFENKQIAAFVHTARQYVRNTIRK